MSNFKNMSLMRGKGKGRRKDLPSNRSKFVDPDTGATLLTDARYGDGTYDRVSPYLTYDPKTGILTRKVPTTRSPAGSIAGCFVPAKGYRVVSVAGVYYEEHNLCWILGHGRLFEGRVVHKDGNRLNNRLDNLVDWVNDDDPTRGLFQGTDGRWNVMMYVRGGGGRRLFATFDDREEAAQVADKLRSLLGQGIDPRRAKTILGLREGGRAPQTIWENKRAAEEEIMNGPHAGKTVTASLAMVYDQESKENKWAVYNLKYCKVSADGAPELYGFCDSRREAQDKLVEYYLRREERGESKLAALYAVGLYPLRVVSVSMVAGQPDITCVIDAAGRSQQEFFAAPKTEEGEEGEERSSKGDRIPTPAQRIRARQQQTGEVVKEMVLMDGTKRYVVAYLETAPLLTELAYYVSVARGSESSLSKEDTWKAVVEYNLLRRTGADHRSALKEAHLVRWDPISFSQLDTLLAKADAGPYQILQDPPTEEVPEGKWFIRGIKRTQERWQIKRPDYGYFETREEAKKALDAYISMLTPVVVREVEGKKPDTVGGHEFALRMTGLLGQIRPA